jgi:hypothetical protein
MNKTLKNKYGSFKSITSNLEKKRISPLFWKKEKDNIIEQIKKGKEEKKSMKMTFEKYHQEFSI